MGRLFPLLFLLDVALLVVALIDCLSSDSGGIRALPRVVWVFIILLFAPIGPIAWFVAGRPPRAVAQPGAQPGARPGGWAPGGGSATPARPARPLAPDDDPDFLRGLAKNRKDDEDLLKRWEEDLRRREDELRRRDGDDAPTEG